MMKYFNALLRFIFFAVFVRFFVLIILGINIRHKKRLSLKSPAIIVSNHNSHLDTLVLINLFPLKLLSKIRAVAAADYFLKNKWIAWFAQEIIGIVPISRKSPRGTDPLIPCYQALDMGKTLILFPEGTRGEPEQLSQFKRGVAYLAEKYPDVPVIPIFIHGLGKSLPKGEFLLVPFFCDVFVGNTLYGHQGKNQLMAQLTHEFEILATEANFAPWK